MKLADLQGSGVPVFAVIRGNEQTGAWLDLATVSHTVEGAADLADAAPGAKDWKAANPPRKIAPLRLTLEPGGESLDIPRTPARRSR